MTAHQGNVPQQLANIARIGNAGAAPNNCHRDLVKKLKDRCKVPQPLLAELPFKSGQAYQSVSLPHEMFSWLFHNQHEHWMELCMPGGPTQLEQFWDKFQHHQLAKGNSFSFSKKSIPIAMHGDGVPTVGIGKVWGKLMEVYSWQPLLAKSGTKKSTFLIWLALGQESDALCFSCVTEG